MSYEDMKKNYYSTIKALPPTKGRKRRKFWVETMIKQVLDTKKLISQNRIKSILPLSMTVWRQYDVTVDEQNQRQLVSLSDGFIIVPFESTFDITLKAHLETDHGDIYEMTKWLKSSKYCMYESSAEVLYAVCEKCKGKKDPVTIKMPDRYSSVALHFVDMKAHQDKSFRYIMVYQELSTEFVQLRPISVENTSDETSIELIRIFSDFYLPKFVYVQMKCIKVFGKVLLRLNDYFKCNIKLIYSEENLDKKILSHIVDWLSRNGCENWAFSCYLMQWEINNIKQSSQSPYEKFFGLDMEAQPQINLGTIDLEDNNNQMDTETLTTENTINTPTTSNYTVGLVTTLLSNENKDIATSGHTIDNVATLSTPQNTSNYTVDPVTTLMNKENKDVATSDYTIDNVATLSTPQNTSNYTVDPVTTLMNKENKDVATSDYTIDNVATLSTCQNTTNYTVDPVTTLMSNENKDVATSDFTTENVGTLSTHQNTFSYTVDPETALMSNENKDVATSDFTTKNVGTLSTHQNTFSYTVDPETTLMSNENKDVAICVYTTENVGTLSTHQNTSNNTVDPVTTLMNKDNEDISRSDSTVAATQITNLLDNIIMYKATDNTPKLSNNLVEIPNVACSEIANATASTSKMIEPDVLIKSESETDEIQEREKKKLLCRTCNVYITTDVYFCSICKESIHLFCGAKRHNPNSVTDNICFFCLINYKHRN